MMREYVISLLALAMLWLLFCLLVALAASESTNYEPTLNLKKTYEYKYEGVVKIGRDMSDLAESGVKLQCTVKITGVSLQLFLLQISNVVFEEFNGVPGEAAFTAAPNLTKRLAAELNKSFTFEYSKGQVIDVKAAADVSNTIVNIVKGILGFLHVTVKTTQRVYELNEEGIHGICHSAYALEENASDKELYVTQVVDIGNCHPKAEMYRGMALAEENKYIKQKGENVFASVKYTYTVKSTPGGGLITKASAHERHHFSPFNVKGGNSKLLAVQTIELIKEADTVGKPLMGQVRSRGNLVYKVEKNLGIMPIMMINLTNPVPKITDIIKHLAQANLYRVNAATSADVLNLIQLLRATAYDDLEHLWKQFSGNSEHRRWLLDTVIEVADERVLKFLKNRFKAGDISANEAGQAILVAFNHLRAEPELVEMAKEFLTMPFSKSNFLLWNAVVLSYGTLVYKVCAHVNPCPITTVQPLLDMATNGLSKGADEEMVIALKALGNAGHPSSLKTIIKFLPGFSSKADSLSKRVHCVAVQSLRHLAIRDPHSVQDISLTLFAEKTLSAEIRMLASMILLETKPPVALIIAMAELLLQETDRQVASFTYSQLRGISLSRSPENQHLSTACNIAMKILAQKLGHLSYQYSKALRLDWFRDDLLLGASSEFYMLRNGTSAVPIEIISKGTLHVIGRILRLTEFGVRAEGLKELFTDRPGITKDFGVTDFAAIMKILSDWQSLPKDKPLLSLYARLFGQEVSFFDLNQDVIHIILQSVSLTASKENKLWTIIEELQKGVIWHWTKPYLVFETQFIQPTCLGLPVEISKYFSVLTTVTVNAKASINPPPKEHLRELLSSDISVETDGYTGVAKDFYVFHGINTELFQCGAQLNSKTVTSLPWKIGIKKIVKEKNFEIHLPPCKKVTELATVNFNVYAVSRNIEDLSSAKMTSMMPHYQNFEQRLKMKEREADGLSAVYNPKLKYCVKSNVYGAAICTELEAKRVHYLEEYPLYYFLGSTHLSWQIEPVTSVRPVEKIKIQISFDPHKHNPELTQMMSITRKMSESTDVIPDPVMAVKVLSLSTAAKPMGYESSAYYTLATQREDIDLIVSEIAEDANWKTCINLNIDKKKAGAKADLRWGAECQSYEAVVKVSTAGITGSKPSINTKINWGDVPEFLKTIGQSVADYFPGVSLLLGFHQKHEKNNEREVSATVLASSPDGFDVKVKIPNLTVYRQGIPSPFEIVGTATDNTTCITI